METNEKAIFLHQQQDPWCPVENCSSFSCFQANLWSLPSWSSVGRKIMQLRRHPQSSRPGQHTPSAYFGPKHNTTADFLHHGSACLLQLQIMHHYWTNLHINVNSHVHEQRFSGNYQFEKNHKIICSGLKLIHSNFQTLLMTLDTQAIYQCSIQHTFLHIFHALLKIMARQKREMTASSSLKRKLP